MEDFSNFWYDCEGLKTSTSIEQCKCEKECSTFLMPLHKYSQDVLENLKAGDLVNEENEIRLLRAKHALYLVGGLVSLSKDFVSLDSSRPWICYWITHALYLLDKEPTYLYPRIIETLSCMRSEYSTLEFGSVCGYGGGPNQLAHCAPIYASILTLCTIGTSESLNSIDRAKLYRFFLSSKHSSGGFCMHRDGEVDCRGTYTVIAISRILNILTPELTAGVADYLVQCQTFEGGFGGEPGNEAHGGYNFCAIAALHILGQGNLCNIKEQEHWLVCRQVRLEGGFQGRTNKLVDSCYSFWQGAALAVVHMIVSEQDDLADMRQFMTGAALCQLDEQLPSQCSQSQSCSNSADITSSNGHSNTVNEDGDVSDTDLNDLQRREGLQEEKEVQCEEVQEGGERIEPVEDDSGALLYNQKALQRYVLHCAQQLEGGGMRDKPGKSRDFYHSCYALSGLSVAQRDLGALPQVYGDSANLLRPTSCVYNIGLTKLHYAISFFASQPSDHVSLVNL